MNMSFMAASIGAISQVIPVGVIVQVILHIIIGMGIIPPIIGIMFIMGIMAPIVCIGIMPPIIGTVIGGIACIGIALLMVLLRIVMTAVCRRRPRAIRACQAADIDHSQT